MKIFNSIKVLFLLVSAQVASQAIQHFYHPDHLYSFSISADWDTIPRNEIIAYTDKVASQYSDLSIETFDGGLTYWNDPTNYFLPPYIVFKFYEEPGLSNKSLDEITYEIAQGYHTIDEELYRDFLNEKRVDYKKKAIFFDYTVAAIADSLHLFHGVFIGRNGLVAFHCYTYEKERSIFQDDFSALFESVEVDINDPQDQNTDSEAFDTYDKNQEFNSSYYELEERYQRQRVVFILSTIVLVLILGILLLRWYRKKSKDFQPEEKRANESGIFNYKRTSKVLKVAGVFLIVLSFSLGLILRFAETDTSYYGFLSIPLLLLGGFLWWRGRQFSDKLTAIRVFGDDKPDVLYLRAFKADPNMYKNIFSSIFTAYFLTSLYTEEEQLREVLKPFGDLTAIGKPGEGLPTPGAARLYAGNEEWQHVVLEKMNEASLVIIRAGVSGGLHWELKQAFNNVDPKKLLILVLGLKRKIYDSFRQQIQSLVNVKFPTAKESKKFVFIGFKEDWTPYGLKAKVPYFRRSVYKAKKAIFIYALRPVFEQFDLPWKAPKISKLTVLSFLFLVLIGLLLLALFITSLF